jgi:acetyl esterase/lipase
MKVGFLSTVLIGAAVTTLAARAEAPAIDAAVAATPVLDDRYPRVAAEFKGDVESFPDLVYSVLPGYRPLRLDLYKPTRSPASAAGFPLVVYIHGGGWQSGHTRHSGAFANWPAVLAKLSSKGYVVVSVEYRLSSEARFPAPLQDVKTAIRWLRARSMDFSIDRTKAVVWGGSAGGQLAALAATSCGIGELAPKFMKDGKPDTTSVLAAQSDCVQGLVAWYGVFDFAAQPLANQRPESADSPIGRYLGCNPAECGPTAALASPITHVEARDPPTLLIHGEIDKVVPATQSKAFHAALRARDVPVELMIIPGVDHSFIGSSEGQTREASLAALSKTFAFIDATIGGKP